jgi:arylesterase/paraoxonase
MKFVKRILAVLGILVLVVVAVSAALLARGGALTRITPQFAGRCEALPLEGSAEDIVVDRGHGIAYLSLLDRQSLVKGEDVQGTVARIDLNNRPFTAVNALASKPGQFRPHGLSLFLGADGERRLFAINHGAKRGVDREAIELFREIAPGEFQHIETLSSPLLISPNDLVATGPRNVYVANDKPLGGALSALLQQFGIGASPVTYLDGASARNVIEDIASGGGINVSPDGRTLYVAETAGKRVRVLTRLDSGDVVDRRTIGISTSPDNIDVAADGSLWVTGHANTLALIRHFISGTPAPTQVWRLELDGAGDRATNRAEVYRDDGSQMSAGSVGATFGKLLLIGSITARQVMICERRG